MTARSSLKFALVASALVAATVAAASAEEIAVANYGSSVSGMPWAIAMDKGFFKQEGVEVSGIRGSVGGSTEIRNMIAGDLAYADTGIGAVLSAVRSGADLKIINENSHSTAQFVWIVMADSPIKALSDLKGKRITFTTPLSVSQSLDFMLLSKAGLKPSEATLISTGPYGAALTALENKGVDVALVAEPVYSLNAGKFRVLAWSRDLFPAMSNTVGITSAKVAAERPDVLRGILRAHRKAVEFMESNRKESAGIIAKVYKFDAAVVEAIMARMIDQPTSDGVKYWGVGDINAADVDGMVEGLRLVGGLKSDRDWRTLVDQSFLPDDLKRKLD